MALTFAQKIADRASAPFVYVTIDSIGTKTGLYKICDRRPRRYGYSATYLDLLQQRPSIEPEQVSPLGGVAEQSELTAVLLDVDDVLTALFRFDAPALTELGAAVAVGNTTITLVSLAGITADETILFVGREAILAGTVSSGTTINVTRGHLGTDARAHAAGRPVYAYTPSLFGRRVRLFLGFDDEDAGESTETELGGGWWIDTVDFDDDLNCWVVQARSRLRLLDRLVHRVGWRGVVSEALWDRSVLRAQGIDARPGAQLLQAHFGDVIFLELGEQEIVRLDPAAQPRPGSPFVQLRILRRAVAGTRADDWGEGDLVRQVYVADREDGVGSFRYQAPGGETADRATGTWIVTDHPVPILLALLTSHSRVTELEPTNWETGTGNYSALPPGVGLGIPIDLIDVDSFLDVWQRTPSFRLPFFTLRAPVTGRKIIDEEICRVTGYDLTVSNGKLSLGYFRTPLESEPVTTWDESVIATEEDEQGNRKPRIRVSLDLSFVASSVVFRTKSAAGADVESVFTDASFPEYFGDADGDYENEDHRIEIEAPSVRVDAVGAEPEMLRHRAIQLAYRFRRPLPRIVVWTDLSQEAVEPGARIALTYAQIPNRVTGVRGVTDLVCRVLVKGEMELREGFVGRSWTLIAYGVGGRFGRVCPSARIASVAGSVATVDANRFTDPNARLSMPAADGLGFAVGDRVRLVTRGGLPIATVPAYQTVTARTGTTLTLDGNFGGSASFTAGTVIDYVPRDSSTAQQFEDFVHLADDATRTVGSSTQTPWTFGEP